MEYRQLGQNGPLISAIGLGGMLLSIQGRPPKEDALATIHAALDAGITLIDTADAYCLDDSEFNHNEALIREALNTRKEKIIVATKVGCRRPGGAWRVDARPEYLVQAAEASLKALGRPQLDLLQLHSPDSRVPFAESVGALARLVEQGKVRHLGLSNVSVEQITEARSIVPIASVQNRFNWQDRSAETSGVLEYCNKHRITFFAYSPFGGAREAPELSLGPLGAEAKKRRVSVYRLILAWLLSKGPSVVPIPGARRSENMKDNSRATLLHLSPEEARQLEQRLASPKAPA